MQVRIRAAALVVGLGFIGFLTGGGVAPGAAQATFSAHCHVIDGSFTSCPDGSSEWSDVPSHAFAKTNAYLYADQADLDPTLAGPTSPADTFELMYDECARTTPLGPGEYFLITFDTVETEDGKEHLNRYAIHVFSDATIIFFENGKTVPDPSGKVRTHEVEGQNGDAGFGPSPTCSADHLIVEFAIKLTATGLKLNGGYSPDPIFWGATPSKVPPTAADDEGDLKDNSSVSVNVVANDTDPDDSVDPSTVSIVDQPKHGTVVNNGDGTVTFTKDDTFKHNDSFTYNVKDGDGLTSNTATVDITKPCSTDIGASVDGKSSPAAAGKTSKKNTDVDKDGILHQDELKAGTDPCNYDTDGDGLPDSWEVPPSIPGSGFDLNGDGSADVSRDQVFGANDPPDPLHKDVYAEIDTYDCNLGGCMPGDPMVHDLNPTSIANVKSMFAGLPAPNPEGGPGITLHLQQNEHIKHEPNCALPPLARPNFGTVDQRTNPQIIDAKALAFRYIVSGHSTLRNGGCGTPSIWDIANNMFREDAPLPDYDNTPFGRATVGGSDIELSLGPVWICPRDKIVAAPIILPLPFPTVIIATVTVCDRESVLDPGIFPTTLPVGSGTRKLKQPLSRGVGRQDPGDLIGTERRGILQVQGRALAHLLGHALGLAAESAVGNDPTLSTPPPGDYWPPEPYPGGTSGLTYADSLHSTSDSGDHLTFSRTGVARRPRPRSTSSPTRRSRRC